MQDRLGRLHASILEPLREGTMPLRIEDYNAENFNLNEALAHASWAAKRISRPPDRFGTYKYSKVFFFDEEFGTVTLMQEPGRAVTHFDPVGECWKLGSVFQTNSDVRSRRESQFDEAVLLFRDGSLAYGHYMEIRAGGIDGDRYETHFTLRQIEALDLLALDFEVDRRDVFDEWENGDWPLSIERNAPWRPAEYSANNVLDEWSWRGVRIARGVMRPGDGFLNALHDITRDAMLGTASPPPSPTVAERRLGAYNDKLLPILREIRERIAADRAQQALIERSAELRRAEQERENELESERRRARSVRRHAWARGVASFLFVLLWTATAFIVGRSISGFPLRMGEIYADVLVSHVALAIAAGLATTIASLVAGRLSIAVPLASIYVIAEVSIWSHMPRFTLEWIGIDKERVAQFFVGEAWEKMSWPPVLIALSVVASLVLLATMGSDKSTRR